MIFSPNDPGVLFACAQLVFRSTDRGDSWTGISPDLTTNANRGAEMIMGIKDSDIHISPNDGISAWPTIVALAESPKMPGVIYAGTDDGQVQVTRDGGKTWTNVTEHLPGLPKGGWISAVVPSRYDAGTVYVTSDSHRIGDFETHIWVSTTSGDVPLAQRQPPTEVVKTLTEDQRNARRAVRRHRDRHLPLARPRQELVAAPGEPAERPRGRDHAPPARQRDARRDARPRALDPRQLVADPGIRGEPDGRREAVLDVAGPRVEGRQRHEQEFWGHQFFLGENPPKEAVIQFSLKAASSDVKLRVSDAAGKTVRELTVPAADAKAGIDSACWDLHVEPLPSQAGGGAGFGRGGAGAGRGGRGGAAGGAAEPGVGRAASNSNFIPDVPAPMPAAGYEPDNPCSRGGRGGGGGGGFGRGGGGQGPYVLPGAYTVALVVGGKVADSKPIKVVLDPTVQLSDVQLRRYYDVLMDLHQMQQRGEDAAQAMEPFYTQMDEIATKLPDMKNVPASVKTQFDAVKKDFDAVRVKFGVPSQAAGGRGRLGGGGGGGGGRGGFNPEARENIVGRAGTLKGEIMAFWEPPSATEMSDYAEIKAGLPKAIADINAVYTKATPLASALAKYDLTLKVPVPAK